MESKRATQERAGCRDRFVQWFTTTASDPERALRVQAVEYENRYFRDLTLEDGRLVKKLATCKIQDDDGRWEEVQDDLQLGVTLSNKWVFRYRRFSGILGCCHYKKRSIEIKKGLEGDAFKGTLLHEMIHAYEYMLAMPLREWLLLDLYQRMEKRLGRRTLGRYIDTNTHAITIEKGHGLLFLLKSLELDERLGWKRGTVFGYGRDGWFKREAEPREETGTV